MLNIDPPTAPSVSSFSLTAVVLVVAPVAERSNGSMSPRNQEEIEQYDLARVKDTLLLQPGRQGSHTLGNVVERLVFTLESGESFLKLFHLPL